MGCLFCGENECTGTDWDSYYFLSNHMFRLSRTFGVLMSCLKFMNEGQTTCFSIQTSMKICSQRHRDDSGTQLKELRLIRFLIEFFFFNSKTEFSVGNIHYWFTFFYYVHLIAVIVFTIRGCIQGMFIYIVIVFSLVIVVMFKY